MKSTRMSFSLIQSYLKLWSRAIPVSYTHLDVYKRQAPIPVRKEDDTIDILVFQDDAARANRIVEKFNLTVVDTEMCIRDRDNMLRITNDGRKLALDMRLINPLAADDPNGKVAVCARNVYRIWEQTKEKRSTPVSYTHLDVYKRQPVPCK